MKKRITSLLFILSLLLSLMITVSHAETTTPPVQACDGQHLNSEGWQAITSASKDTSHIYLTGGKYYLDEDFSSIGIIYIMGETTLCLNGHTYSANRNGSAAIVIYPKALTGTSGTIYSPNGTTPNLTICDCTVSAENPNGSGKIENIKAGATNPGVACITATYVSHITLQGGTISGFGGYGISSVSTADGSAVTISGGCITGNAGGVTSKVPFTMTGGTITGNTSTANGGGVLLAATTGTISGGTISNNTATTSGGGIYTSGDLNVSGTANISTNTATASGGGIYLDGGTLNMSGGSIRSNKTTATGSSGYGGGIYANAGTITLTGGSIEDNTASGNYGGGILLATSQLNISGSTTINKNNAARFGGGIGLNNTASAIQMSGGTISNNQAGTDGGGIFLHGSSSLTMSGDALITGNQVGTEASPTASKGGGVCIYNAKASLTMNGGTISNNHVYTSAETLGGGGVYVSGATMTINSGTISGNTSTYGGSGIYSTGTLTINNGTISGNTAATTGGGICSTGALTIAGGTIYENTATRGAGICVIGDGATTSISGGTITKNTALKPEYAGGVYFQNAGGTNKLTGGSFTENTGTGITAHGSSIVTFSDVTVNGNAGGSYSNVLLYNKANVTVNSGTIEDIVVKADDESNLTSLTVYNGKIANGISTDGASAGTVISLSGGRYGVKPDSTYIATGYTVSRDSLDADYPYLVAGEPFYIINMESSLELIVGVPFDSTSGFPSYTVTHQGQTSGMQSLIESDTYPGYILMSYAGIAAKEMRDTVTFTVYAGSTAVRALETSIYEIASGWYADPATSDEQKLLLADMLNYGRAAQAAFHYNEANMGDELTGSTAPTWTGTSGAGVDTTAAVEAAATLSLKDTIELNIYIEDSNVTLTNVTFNGETCTDCTTATVNDGAVTRVTFDKIAVKDAKGVIGIEATLSTGDKITVTYSIVDYVLSALKGDQAALIQALQKYVESASSYLNG